MRLRLAAVADGVRSPRSFANEPVRLPVLSAVRGGRARFSRSAAPVCLPVPAVALSLRTPLSSPMARERCVPLFVSVPVARAALPLAFLLVALHLPVLAPVPAVRVPLSRARPRCGSFDEPVGEVCAAVVLRAPGAPARRSLSTGDAPGWAARLRGASAVPSVLRAPAGGFEPDDCCDRGAGAALAGAEPGERAAPAVLTGLRADGLPERTGARSGVLGRGCLAVSLTRIDSRKNRAACAGVCAAVKQRL